MDVLRMKKLCSILVLSCICMSLHAQIRQNCLEIELGQTDLSYTTDSTRNDYYREIIEKQDDYKLVHDADSSYRVEMVGEGISGYFPDKLPSFQGGDPLDFCILLGKRIISLLENGEEHTFRLAVDFILSSNGELKDIRVDPFLSDKERTSLHESILTIIRESPRWVPEKHYRKKYCTPLKLRISSDHFVKGEGMVIIRDYSTYYFDRLMAQLRSDSPEEARSEEIPDDRIASDNDIDEKAHLEDESLNLNQWIKSNIQDATEMVGFGDGESEIELVISANGWVAKATVINSYDRLLGEHLANELLIRSPRWVPAKANGISVPSKVRITYSWRF